MSCGKSIISCVERLIRESHLYAPVRWHRKRRHPSARVISLPITFELLPSASGPFVIVIEDLANSPAPGSHQVTHWDLGTATSRIGASGCLTALYSSVGD